MRFGSSISDTRFGSNSATTSPSGSSSCDMRNAPTGSFLSDCDISALLPAAFCATATSAAQLQPQLLQCRRCSHSSGDGAASAAATSASTAQPFQRPRRALRQQIQRHVFQQQLSDDVRFGSNSATCVRFGNSCSSFSDSDISALQRSSATAPSAIATTAQPLPQSLQWLLTCALWLHNDNLDSAACICRSILYLERATVLRASVAAAFILSSSAYIRHNSNNSFNQFTF